MICAAILFTVQVTAQSDKYVKAMEAKIAEMNKASTSAAWQDVGNAFQRIGEAEKTQWLPFYYAAVSNVMTGLMLSKEDFVAWTKSENFRAAHKNAGSTKATYIGHPQFEGFSVVEGA